MELQFSWEPAYIDQFDIYSSHILLDISTYYSLVNRPWCKVDELMQYHDLAQWSN